MKTLFYSRSPIRQQLEVMLILVVLLLTGCATAPISPGEVEAIQDTTALYIMQQAVSGATKTFMMQSPDGKMMLFAKNVADGWGFTPLDVAAKDVIGKWRWCGGGNYTDCKGMADLVDWLITKSNWNFVQPDKLSPELVAAITQASTWARTLHTIPALIIPAGSFDIMPDILGVKDNDT